MKCPKRSQIFKAKSTKAAVDFRMSPMVFGNPCKLLNKKIYISFGKQYLFLKIVNAKLL